MKPKPIIVLETKILKYGDTNETLSEYLGVDRSTVIRKRTKESPLTVADIKMLHRRYQFTEDEILELVFGEDFLYEIKGGFKNEGRC